MKEYRSISLDRFDGINLESTVYMLSHNHSGKYDNSFPLVLKSSSHSSSTKQFLLQDTASGTIND